MPQQSPDIPLHDIEPLMIVQDYSFYYFLLILSILLALLALVGYLLLRYFRAKKRVNIRLLHKKEIEKLDINDTKAFAYGITKYGYTFKDDSPRHSQMYENLVDRLSAYKYKKGVDSFDEETKSYIAIFREMCNAS